LLGYAFEPRFDSGLWDAIAAVPAVLLGFALRFLLGWCLALAAFWVTRTSAINNIYLGLLLFFSGRVAPVDVLPAWLEQAARLLPFYGMIAFPVELALGRLSPAQALHGFTVQIVWLSGSLVLLAVVWRSAVRRYGAVGG
jgi:ABC-2 type transport system permease protein